MTAAISALLLVVILAGWALLPLLGRWDESEQDETPALLEQKHGVYRAMLDLEHDHEVGKVADEDFRIMRRELEAEAVNLIKVMDESSDLYTASELLEREIAAARDRRKL